MTGAIIAIIALGVMMIIIALLFGHVNKKGKARTESRESMALLQAQAELKEMKTEKEPKKDGKETGKKEEKS